MKMPTPPLPSGEFLPQVIRITAYMLSVLGLIYPVAVTAFGRFGNTCFLSNQITNVSEQLQEVKTELKNDMNYIESDINHIKGDINHLKQKFGILGARQSDIERYVATVTEQMLKNCGIARSLFSSSVFFFPGGRTIVSSNQ